MKRLDRYFTDFLSQIRHRPMEIGPEAPPRIIEIVNARANVAAGEKAAAWLKHEYTAYFMAFLDDQAEALHDRLIQGDVSGEAYREAFKILERVKSQARTIVAAGEASQGLLLEWSKDGTIAEANAWIADHPGAVNGGV